MTSSRRWLAAAALVVVMVALTACTRGSANQSTSPGQVYAASPTESDVRSLLGSKDWWESTPSFGLPPLGLPGKVAGIRFQVSTKFIHIGTSEFFGAQYIVFDSSTTATLIMTQIQNTTGGSSSPREGDQVVYQTQKQFSPSALFSNAAYVRVGQTIILIDWERDQGFVDNTTMGRIASKVVSKLKDVTSGKVKPSPLPSVDTKLLPPAGLEITLVGAAKLPIESAVASLGYTSPQAAVDQFHQLGVNEFVFGDYALNVDLNMEMRAFVLTFQSPDDATGWLSSAVGGAANLDPSGVATGYAAGPRFYYAFFASGTHGAMLFCNALDFQEAPARACEAPLGSIIPAWQSSLASA